MTNALPWLWEITTDHMHDEDPGFWQGIGVPNKTGVQGPRNADLTLKDKVPGYTFRMYDDDGELYFTGKLYVTPETLDNPEHNESALYSPLGDFGMPNAGAVVIKYHGHPEWEIG